MLRTLFFEFPHDPTSWLVDDEYFFGHDLLVAPMFDEAATRRVYLPPGAWTDYQSGRVFQGGQWQEIAPGTIPVVLLVRDHTVIPHIPVAQSTSAMRWTDIELRVFSSDDSVARGAVTLPAGGVYPIRVERARLLDDPFSGQVRWRVTRAAR
jgi:alpha-D-xyloside xylohydrolase